MRTLKFPPLKKNTQNGQIENIIYIYIYNKKGSDFTDFLQNLDVLLNGFSVLLVFLSVYSYSSASLWPLRRFFDLLFINLFYWEKIKRGENTIAAQQNSRQCSTFVCPFLLPPTFHRFVNILLISWTNRQTHSLN